jgi:hypothetical protein
MKAFRPNTFIESQNYHKSPKLLYEHGAAKKIVVCGSIGPFKPLRDLKSSISPIICAECEPHLDRATDCGCYHAGFPNWPCWLAHKVKRHTPKDLITCMETKKWDIKAIGR